jgi:flavin reductase (DIM6/NTAB) family NADH-FMN oxidoreductase RutF
MTEKVFFAGLDLLKPRVSILSKIPRTIVLPIVKDKRTAYLNAAPYSAAVMNEEPLHILFCLLNPSTAATYEEVDEFSIAVPSKEQLDNVWVMALAVPQGINEIEVAGWHELPSHVIETSGIAECAINLECRKIHFLRLPPPMHSIVIGEVAGLSIDKAVLGHSRAETIQCLPLHEAGSNPQTGLYAPSTFSGEMQPRAVGAVKENSLAGSTIDKTGKVFLKIEDLYRPEEERVLMNAVFPRPCTILLTACDNGKPHGLLVVGGFFESISPSIKIPVPRDSVAYRNLKRSKECMIAIPDRKMIKILEQLDDGQPHDFEAFGLHLFPACFVRAHGIMECPVNIEAKIVSMVDIPRASYALLVGRKVAVHFDKELHRRVNKPIPDTEMLTAINTFYSTLPYAVLDQDRIRKYAFQRQHNPSVKPLPTWGSPHGGWWRHRYGSFVSLINWFNELVAEGLITASDQSKIRQALALWNEGWGPAHLAEFFDEKTREELRKRLTKLFRMMAWAHRDLNKWNKVRKYIASTFPSVERDIANPLFHEQGYGRAVYSKTKESCGEMWY